MSSIKSNRNDPITAKFKAALKLEDHPDITLNHIQTISVVNLITKEEYSKIDACFIFLLKCYVEISTLILRVNGTTDVSQCAKLRIDIKNEFIKREIISCINYLQRQRNIHLALSILKRNAQLISERNLILDMLLLHSQSLITHEIHKDGGILVKCQDKRSHFKYFESQWKIQFDCKTHQVVDFIDFSVNIRNKVFHDSVMDTMNMLVIPNLDYNQKVELWWKILFALKIAVSQNTMSAQPNETRDFLTVRTVQEINLTGAEDQFEVIDDYFDDENCIVIDD